MTKTCHSCGVEFRARTVASKYCSRRCGWDAIPGADIVERTCRCGKVFESRRHQDKKSCSTMCGLAASSANRKRLYEAGFRSGQLLVLKLSERGGYRFCRCDCGIEKEISVNSLGQGVKSCGCLRRKSNLTHGMANSREYKSWCMMHSRCSNPNYTYYYRYGGRGIRVCDRWNSFESFYADMGQRPAGKSLDRINNDGNYEPGNCRWSTQKEQIGNRSPYPKNRKRPTKRCVEDIARERMAKARR